MGKEATRELQKGHPGAQRGTEMRKDATCRSNFAVASGRHFLHSRLVGRKSDFFGEPVSYFPALIMVSE